VPEGIEVRFADDDGLLEHAVAHGEHLGFVAAFDQWGP
jgi:hypothetical protein